MKRLLFLVIGFVAALMSAELFLQALPVSTSTKTGYYISPNILTNPPNHVWTMATGWDLRDVQHMHSNNMGFAAEHDFVPASNAVGLVGDSYVEASMLAMGDRPAAQLEKALGGYPVYAMGGPGSSLLDYAERIRWARQTLGIKTFVVMMEHADASQAVCGSGNVHARCLQPQTLQPVVERVPPSGLLKSVLRASALAQYLNSQLKFSAGRLSAPAFWRSGAPSDSGDKLAATPASATLTTRQQTIIDTAINAFFSEMDALDDIHMIFVIDMNRRNLYTPARWPDESYHMAERLRSRGCIVVMGEPLYRQHLQHSSLRLEMGPHDQHLNKIGVALLMKAAAHDLHRQGNGVQRY
ncbi:hypothetical protein HUU62_12655 [Rhodoferax sp. 4810]|nr:hypothetical protein [Rhodoferax jenense]